MQCSSHAVQSPLEVKLWGLKEFFVCDPFRNLIVFAEGIPEEEASADIGGTWVSCPMGRVVAIRRRKGQLQAMIRGWGRWYTRSEREN